MMDIDWVIERYEGWVQGQYPNQNVPHIFESAVALLQNPNEQRIYRQMAAYPEFTGMALKFPYLEQIANDLHEYMKKPEFNQEQPNCDYLD